MVYRLSFMMMMMTASFVASAQIFSMEKVNHSLSYLILTTDSTIDRWRLPFPVYQFCVGDVDHDGNDDALVGVEKTTRFDSEIKKRLFIFKNYKGRIRALWMGSQLGGILEDFRVVDNHVVSLQTANDGKYAVLQHEWRKFGLGFKRFLISNVSREEAEKFFRDDSLLKY